jgi:hypothetical protein
MNEQALRAVLSFAESVLEYMRMEYDPFWAEIYSSPEFSEEMFEVTSMYYFGGNTVCNAAGDIAAYIGRM